MLEASKALKIAIFTIAFIALSIKVTDPAFRGAISSSTFGDMAVPLKVSISELTSASLESPPGPAVNLKVTIENTSDKPVSFLRWSSPFDTRASPMGVFVFTSQKTGEPAECVGLKINRKMPESGAFDDEDVVKIAAGAKVEKDVQIKTPDVILQQGEAYTVKAKGNWMHVKVGDHPGLSTSEEGVLRGEFESSPVEFSL